LGDERLRKMAGRLARWEARSNGQSAAPTDVWSMNNIALVLIQQGRFDEALPPLARTVQLDSSVAVLSFAARW